jgi:hypothetical protein
MIGKKPDGPVTIQFATAGELSLFFSGNAKADHRARE